MAEDRSFVLWTLQLVDGNRAGRTIEKHGNFETHTYLDKAESQGQNVEESLAWAKPKLKVFIKFGSLFDSHRVPSASSSRLMLCTTQWSHACELDHGTKEKVRQKSTIKKKAKDFRCQIDGTDRQHGWSVS